MTALTILIIRHAEKPGDPAAGPGLTSAGAPDDKSLVIRGWQRAGAWAARFGPKPCSSDYPSPAAIYAADPASISGEDPSARPFETIGPLAARLGLEPDTSYSVGQEGALATEVLGKTGVVLICWEHKAIGKVLVPAILAGQSLPTIPAAWDDARFDVVYRFDRSAQGPAWSFRQLFPQLLGGDSNTPM